jgi:ribonuclease VapC
MIVDTSALVAILLRQEGWETLVSRLEAANEAAVATPTLAETGIVLSSRMGKDARPTLLRFLQESEVTMIDFGEHHWRAAVEAYRRFGKGNHPARLNFGDCMSYAVASLAGQALLYTGKDFGKTDLPLA